METIIIGSIENCSHSYFELYQTFTGVSITHIVGMLVLWDVCKESSAASVGN